MFMAIAVLIIQKVLEGINIFSSVSYLMENRYLDTRL